MRNPLRSEAAAFRFLGLVIAGAAVIVAAAYANTWAGVVVAVVVFAWLGWWLRHGPRPEATEAPGAAEAAAESSVRRLLVVAAPGTERVPLPREAEVLVVVPADERRGEAETTVAVLGELLPGARVEVGADDPALAVEEALRGFRADEVIVAGSEETARAIRARVALPVTRV